MALKTVISIKDNSPKVAAEIKKLIKRIKNLGDKDIYVGVPSDAPNNPSTGMNPVAYGTIHEFGLAKFPERSFLRSVIEDNGIDYAKEMIARAKLVISNGGDIDDQKALVGEMVAGDVKLYILGDNVSPSSQSEVTLVDTGHLVSVITYKIG